MPLSLEAMLLQFCIVNVLLTLCRSENVSFHEDLTYKEADPWTDSNGRFPLPPSQFPENCSLLVENFTAEVMNFTLCSVMNSFPIKLCNKCWEPFNTVNDAYNALKSGPSDCAILFFGSDQLGVIDAFYRDVTTLWSSAHCDNCYKDINETRKFFTVLEALDECIEATNSSLKDNKTCEQCRPLYHNLSNNIYKYLEAEFEGAVCMDIVDRMNSTRHTWNEKYGCMPNFDTSFGLPNIFTVLTVFLLPVSFYLLARYLSNLEDVQLVRPKRKSFVNPQQ